MSMTKSRSQELSEKAAAERRRCRDRLIPFMQNGQPKFLTKDELRVAAMGQLNVSKSSFDFAWIDAIETTGRPVADIHSLMSLPVYSKFITSS
jgi:hypothetical protein